jgi:excisionase family DNA binding protein
MSDKRSRFRTAPALSVTHFFSYSHRVSSFGEPAPRFWGERRLISVAEATEWLGGISPSTFYALVKEGELSLVKIGRRSFVRAEELDDFVRRKRYDASG